MSKPKPKSGALQSGLRSHFVDAAEIPACRDASVTAWSAGIYRGDDSEPSLDRFGSGEGQVFAVAGTDDLDRLG